MKSRIIDGFFAGVYTDEFLTQYKDTVQNGQLVSEWTIVDSIPPLNLNRPKWNGIEFIEGITQEELDYIRDNTLALNEAFVGMGFQDYKTVMFDKLPGIKRRESLFNKGLKQKFEYEKDGILVFSIETKYWFDSDTDFPQGIKKIANLYAISGKVYDSWYSEFVLTEDAKQNILQQQREKIFIYFKSQQPELFELLYSFFKEDIEKYIRIGGKETLQTILEDAMTNHPFLNEKLSLVIPTQKEGIFTTVLQGILDELV